jgi:hypothetical protein
MARALAFALGALAVLIIPTPRVAAVDYGLELASADISWRVCRAGFSDPMFAGVCAGSGSARNPLHVAVTVSATWWAVPDSRAVEGPARWRADPLQKHVLLPRLADSSHARSVGWKVFGAGAPTVVVAPNAAGAGYSGADAYAFAVTHVEQLSTKTNSSLHHVLTRLSFMVQLPHAGEFEVAFTGCCRWADLANIRQEGYPNKVPWRIVSTVQASTNSALAPSFSPRLSMPITQVVLWHSTRAAFSLHADNGGRLVTLVDETDMAGRYLETESPMSLDPSVYVTTNTKYAAYVRDDGGKSIVWFQAPETGTNQFGASGAALLPEVLVVAVGQWCLQQGSPRPSLLFCDDAQCFSVSPLSVSPLCHVTTPSAPLCLLPLANPQFFFFARSTEYGQGRRHLKKAYYYHGAKKNV